MPTYAFPVIGYPKGKIPLHWGSSPNAADLFAKPGTPIQAMVDGRIDFAGWDETGGWYVYLIGDPATKSLHYYMAHMLERPAVTTGQRVAVGQLLGKVGETGNAVGTGAHLHIGIGTSIMNGSGPEGGAGVPWPGNNCNKYLQTILDTIGSGPSKPGLPTPAPNDKDALIAALYERIDGLETAVRHLANVTVPKAAEAGKAREEALEEARTIREQQEGAHIPRPGA